MNTYERIEQYIQDRIDDMIWWCKEKDFRTPITHAGFWITAVILGILFWTWIFLTFAPMVKYVFADTASYYTYNSCRREGTSGVWTASGERFNENDLTCAMRSKEWGAVYKVTNTANGKSVMVRLTDFGPNKKLWNKGRKVDLSKEAFKRIASLKQGVINVKIERVK